jgi:protein involved in polysaccharide export with SLBB domain
MHKLLSSYPLLTFLLIFSFSVSGQNSNDPTSYVKALPASIQSDVLREMASGEEIPDPRNYRGPRTTVEQLDSTLEKIQLQLDEIENEVSETDKGSSALQRFGESFFTSFQTTFSPINLPNLSGKYIVDVSDQFSFQFPDRNIGKDIMQVIERDGTLSVPSLGKISIAGLSLDQAIELIKSRYSQRFIGKEIEISLSKLRDVNVLLVGNVKFPGLYTLPGNATTLSLLNAAGGIKSSGTYRNITVKGANGNTRNLDLYNIFVFGQNDYFHLSDGDVVMVNPTGPQVSVSGGIANPGIYELKSEDDLESLFTYAGSFTPSANLGQIEVRHNQFDNYTTEVIALESIKQQQLNNGDNIKVGLFEPKNEPLFTVEILGQVNKPGKYDIKPGETLSSLINRAGGYTQNAYPLGGVLTRASTKIVEQASFDRIYREMIVFLASSAQASSVQSQQDQGAGKLALILDEFKKQAPKGRVTANFNLQDLKQNPSQDIRLQNGDKITIPIYSGEVYVYGEVMNPGSKMYRPDFNGKDYINLAGGLGRFSESDRVIIIHPNGDSYLLSSGLSIFTKDKIDIYPGSIIYTPREIGVLEGVSYAATIAPIFSSLALSLASLNSIGN